MGRRSYLLPYATSKRGIPPRGAGAQLPVVSVSIPVTNQCATSMKVTTAQPSLFASPHRRMTVPAYTDKAVKTCSGHPNEKAG